MFNFVINYLFNKYIYLAKWMIFSGVAKRYLLTKLNVINWQNESN